MGSKCWREACVVGCTRWGLARTWRCWAELKESARAFEGDWDGGGGRSSIGDGGARMRRGRSVTEAGGREGQGHKRMGREHVERGGKVGKERKNGLLQA